MLSGKCARVVITVCLKLHNTHRGMFSLGDVRTQIMVPFCNESTKQLIGQIIIFQQNFNYIFHNITITIAYKAGTTELTHLDRSSLNYKKCEKILAKKQS